MSQKEADLVAAQPTEPTTRPSTRHKFRTRDKRILALRQFAISITILTVVGQWFLGFEQAWAAPVAGVLTGYVVELLMESVEAWSRGRRPYYAGGALAMVDFLLPAHISGLACALLIYGNSRVLPTVFTVAVAIVSKYVIRVRIDGRPRHILNPSNFGIGLTLLAFPSVGMLQPYMFVETLSASVSWIVPVVLLTLGTMLNARLTGRIPMILAWLAGFVLQALVRAVLQSHTAFLGEIVTMAGATFILYTNYMITDPGTTPHSRRGQIYFGLSLAATYGVFMALHIVFAFFWALTVVGLVRLVWYSGRNHLPTVAALFRTRRMTAGADSAVAAAS
ncbi:hypothetical protein F3087_40785 [Nocardia colli]|uniref:Enediyne biosynthesis protein n=1 Tax=Nocardia colli TaxID=2545717 RepID=A0A5N0DU83_9NOCA|nr:hypothetical protein [Nocardia colli]KAA8880652.1 hypothetical protein F3087_40785 [Nocardia colli]